MNDSKEKNDKSSNEEDGYETDLTSSYDFNNDFWFEIQRRKRNGGLQGPEKHNERRNEAPPSLKGLPAPSHAATKQSNTIAAISYSQEAIHDLYEAAKPFYSAPCPVLASSTPDMDPLPKEQQGTTNTADGSDPKLKKRKQASSGDSEVDEDYPRVVSATRNPKRILNDLESNHIPCPLSRTATITFREALVVTDKPRIITLSYPPFVVVHINSAYMSLTGFASIEVLGLPLYKCFGVEFQEEFPSSVTSLQDRVAPIASKQQQPQSSDPCFIKVLLVGPEPSEDGHMGSQSQEEEEEDAPFYYVTHYCLELEAVKVSTDSNLRTALVSSDSSFYGVLG